MSHPTHCSPRYCLCACACPRVVRRLEVRWSPFLVVTLLLVGWAGLASAQTPFVPYFGKNNIHYDKFDWHIYTTDHFEIYYYPEIESISSASPATPKAPISRSAPT